MAKPLQLDGAVQWLRESAARAKERRKVRGLTVHHAMQGCQLGNCQPPQACPA